MGQQYGIFEWDDDELTPGRKKEGGWSQNLFDSDGHLKANARFVPLEEEPDDDLYETSLVYVPTEQRRLNEEEEKLAQFLGAILAEVIREGIEAALPHVKNWWSETAKPTAVSTIKKVAANRKKAKEKPEKKAIHVNKEQCSEDLEATPKKPTMSKAEAQARTLAALAAQMFSQEQFDLIRDARIVDERGEIESSDIFAEVPQKTLNELVKQLAHRPELLSDMNLAGLASWFSAQQTREIASSHIQNEENEKED